MVGTAWLTLSSPYNDHFHMLLLSAAGTTTSAGDCPHMPEPTLPACRKCLRICNPKEQPLARCRRANGPSPDP